MKTEPVETRREDLGIDEMKLFDECAEYRDVEFQLK